MATTLPPITQQPVNYVDSTPDVDYPRRILDTYLTNTRCRWAEDTSGGPVDPTSLCGLMNAAQDRRAALLREALAILGTAENRRRIAQALADVEA